MAERVSDRRILDATAASLRARGVDGATTREIARLAGVNEVTLFRRFGDKGQLVRAAVHDAIARLGPADFAPTDDVRADLAAIVRFYVAALDPTTGIALALLVEAGRHPHLADLLEEPIAVLGRAGEVIRHHQRRGSLAVEPVGDALAALIGPVLVRGLGRTLGARGVPRATADATRFATRLTDAFLRGHAAHPGAD